jgi:hypothetical protein
LRWSMVMTIRTLARFRVDVPFVADPALIWNGEDDVTAFLRICSADGKAISDPLLLGGRISTRISFSPIRQRDCRAVPALSQVRALLSHEGRRIL